LCSANTLPVAASIKIKDFALIGGGDGVSENALFIEVSGTSISEVKQSFCSRFM
jgi:hypothetical protein